MQCPKCSAGSNRVVDTITFPDKIWRYRKCSACGFKFRTEEVATLKKFSPNTKFAVLTPR